MENLETVVIQLDERARQLIYWAALAEFTDKKDVRSCFRGAGLSPDGRLYVTNGRRMHIVRLSLRGNLARTIHLSHEELRTLATGPYGEIVVHSDGQEPIQYEQAIPKEPKHVLTFLSAQKLRGALNRLKVQLKEHWGFRSAYVAFFPVSSSSGGGIALYREGGTGRGGKSILPEAVCLEGTGSENAPLWRVDVRYLQEAIQLVDGEVRLCFDGSLDPGAIGDLTTGDYLALVMPKRIENEDKIRTAWYALHEGEQHQRTA